MQPPTVRAWFQFVGVALHVCCCLASHAVALSWVRLFEWVCRDCYCVASGTRLLRNRETSSEFNTCAMVAIKGRREAVVVRGHHGGCYLSHWYCQRETVAGVPALHHICGAGVSCWCPMGEPGLWG